jgi:SAM-dependent methyltransferase
MKDSMRAPWIAGSYGAIAREIGAPEAERFVARITLEPGARVLDIACGAGNVTVPLARWGAMVTGLDMTPHLLEEARARATREGLHISFDEGFAETLAAPPPRTPANINRYIGYDIMNKPFLTGLKGLFLTSLISTQTMAKAPASVPGSRDFWAAQSARISPGRCVFSAANSRSGARSADVGRYLSA